MKSVKLNSNNICFSSNINPLPEIYVHLRQMRVNFSKDKVAVTTALGGLKS